jgi:prolyl-tRNA editing enzyme YbaK/EbsC (Cys-tRNA(Pro) deacylase)
MNDIDTRVLETLRSLEVPHEVIHIDPAYADTEEFCARYGFPLETSANTIVVASKRGEKRYVACVLLATTRLDVNGVVRRTMGFSKASFADAEETAALTGMEIGGVTPFALPEGLPILVDARVLEQPEVIVGAGSRDKKLSIDPAGLLALPDARAVPDLAKPAGG